MRNTLLRSWFWFRSDHLEAPAYRPCGMEPLEKRLLMTNDKTLWGYVFCDADNDGYRDAGEKGIANVTITVTGTDRLGAVLRTTKTDANGFYQFTQLNPGTYTLKETQPAGITDGKDQLGKLYDAVTGLQVGVRGTLGNDMFSNIQIPKGNPVIGKNYNFGELCEPPEKLGREGLTPGFWKNHTSLWQVYKPNQTLESVFNVPDSLGLDNKTLLEALQFGGGPGVKGAAQNMFRHAVAAILNASHKLVDYPITTSTIISKVNTALASNSVSQLQSVKNLLESYNQLGGGIDAHGRPI